ncbi:MAG: tRNA (5-methylaminomethyl-2-thiouridine)(34)-methyltransferase MnmD [Prevotellaceae bacterium]|jgi:tRNA U34 5-methylaminomethyl-2-thiouridine-forming methyltransferase MnmC|nr:tRNA (5-methylaminomethyl-2-thiouridine)(34)-methyltransferase MnmD [Prevotellaceae bacterium]
MMKRQFIITDDGSHTLFVPELNETYHSTRGAMQESLHVFLQAGFRCAISYLAKQPIRVLEVGFGTGLNALLTWQEAEYSGVSVYYEAVEKYPLDEKEAAALNYPEQGKLVRLHGCQWETPIALSPCFTLCKRNVDLLEYVPMGYFEVIYFDAFAPDVQPELWSKDVFHKLYEALNPGGILVTYSAKGMVKTVLRDIGFEVQRLAGAAGKRHMIRAVKR